jgi:hypothetical protein
MLSERKKREAEEDISSDFNARVDRVRERRFFFNHTKTGLTDLSLS